MGVHRLAHLKQLGLGGAARLVHKVSLRSLKPAVRLMWLFPRAVGYCRGPEEVMTLILN